MSASDADEGEDGRVTYRLLMQQPPPAAAPFFLLHPQGGGGGVVVTLLATLDRESQDAYLLVLEARDSSAAGPSSATVSLTVSVTDVNDNAPVCVHPAQLLVPSSAVIGDPLLALTCSDVDLANGRWTFVKTAGDTSGVFGVDPDTGEVRLLRAPTEPRYELRIEVLDGGSPEYSTFVTVTFLIEDSFAFANLPAVVEIPEDTAVYSVIFDTNTVGSALPSFFEINGGNGVFAVEPSTGEIVLTSSVDREAVDSYQVTVIAHTAAGHSATSTATVSVLDTNDNAPVILGTFNVSVSENITVPSDPLQVFSARDEDLQENGTVTFRITAGNDAGHFSLDGQGQLRVVSPLDADSVQLHDLVIVAEDGGAPPLTAEKHVLVTVVGVDEFRPEFLTAGQSLNLSLWENTAIGAPVIRVEAEDADLPDDVKLDLVSGNVDDTFVVDRDTGSLYLARLLDREQRPDFQLVIRVSNSKQESKTSTITLRVDDVNDNAPAFSRPQYMYDVAHDTAPATSIGDIPVTDPDDGINAEVDLEIVAGDANHVFVFDGFSLTTNTPVDISAASSYNLTVSATDKGSPALFSIVNVLITVTPENVPPKFLSSEANRTVQENSLTGTAIYDCQATAAGATEGESGDIVYSITSGNNRGCFHLDQFTGQLYVVKDLDYEQEHSHTVSILAEHRSDAALFDVMTFTVYVENVNDGRPSFWSDYLWPVQEDTRTGSTVGTVQARDTDDGPFGEVSLDFK